MIKRIFQIGSARKSKSVKVINTTPSLRQKLRRPILVAVETVPSDVSEAVKKVKSLSCFRQGEAVIVHKKSDLIKVCKKNNIKKKFIYNA